MEQKLYAIKNPSQRIKQYPTSCIWPRQKQTLPPKLYLHPTTVLPDLRKTWQQICQTFRGKKPCYGKELLADACHSEKDPEIKVVI